MPALVILLVAAAFLIGVLFTKVQYLEGGGTYNAGTTTTTGGQTAAAPPVTVDINQIKNLFSDKYIHFGDANAKNLFVMVSDPSCPYCHLSTGLDPELNQQSGGQFSLVSQGGTYDPPVVEMRKLVDSGQASFAWLYYAGHGNGEMGAKALYCAYDQGKFWEAHDLLMSEKGYEIQNGYDASNATITGTVVGNDKTKSGDMANFLSGVLNANTLKACLDSGKYDSRLQSEQSLATSLGVSGTPGFFINDNRIDGADNWTNMETSLK